MEQRRVDIVLVSDSPAMIEFTELTIGFSELLRIFLPN